MKRDTLNIAILAMVVLAAGIYLITTTVLTSKDGVFYIRTAQELAATSDALKGSFPLGYPLMVRGAHAVGTIVGQPPGNASWVLAGQCVSLAARLFTIIPLYLIGRQWLGPRHAFMSLLLFVLLPLPAQAGADVLRDWPYLLFFVTGLFLLIQGAKTDRPWFFAALGLVSMLGVTVRTEACQLVLFGLMWLGWRIFSKESRPQWRRHATSAVLLLAVFLLPTVGYFAMRGAQLPKNLNIIRQQFQHTPQDEHEASIPSRNQVECMTAGVDGRLLDLGRQVLDRTSANLLWIFFPAFIIGTVYRLRYRADRIERFVLYALTGVTACLLVSRYYLIGPSISSRYLLPLITVLNGHTMTGVIVAMAWCIRTLRRTERFRPFIKKRAISLHTLLMTFCVIVCVPVMLKPIHHDKTSYRAAVQWLGDKTPSHARVASFDIRIPFLADRPEGSNETGYDYVVRRIKIRDTEFVGGGWREVFRGCYGKPANCSYVVIYQTR